MRFLIEGALAIHYGRWIVRQAQSPLLEHVMIALVIISIGGSIFSVYQWSDNQKTKQPAAQAGVTVARQ